MKNNNNPGKVPEYMVASYEFRRMSKKYSKDNLSTCQAVKCYRSATLWINNNVLHR